MPNVPYADVDWAQIADDDVIEVIRTVVHRGPAKWVRDTLDRRLTARDQDLLPFPRDAERAITETSIILVEVKRTHD